MDLMSDQGDVLCQNGCGRKYVDERFLRKLPKAEYTEEINLSATKPCDSEGFDNVPPAGY